KMPRGGARAGAGRRKVVPENHGEAPRKNEATEIIDSLGKPRKGHAADCRCWKCLWKRDAEREDQVGQHARKYLWDRRDGKPVDTVNHLHDKPIEMHHTISLSERIKAGRERILKNE